MQYQALSAIRSKVETDLDLQEETFITSAEVNAYINEAIRDCQALIHTIYEDYFLKSAALALVQNTSTYSLPSDIYANKIRRITYVNGPIMYEITRLKDRDGFLQGPILDLYPPPLFYKYRLINTSAATGIQIELHPPAQETSASNVKIWYLRNANTLTLDTDLCDIPEFYDYIIQFAKVRCYEKEPGHPNYMTAVQDRERLRDLMVSTLSSMVPDGDNAIELDVSFYQEHS